MEERRIKSNFIHSHINFPLSLKNGSSLSILLTAFQLSISILLSKPIMNKIDLLCMKDGYAYSTKHLNLGEIDMKYTLKKN